VWLPNPEDPITAHASYLAVTAQSIFIKDSSVGSCWPAGSADPGGDPIIFGLLCEPTHAAELVHFGSVEVARFGAPT